MGEGEGGSDLKLTAEYIFFMIALQVLVGWFGIPSLGLRSLRIRIDL